MVDSTKYRLPFSSTVGCLSSHPTQTFYVKENNLDLVIINRIEAIVQCLRSEEQFCTNVPDEGVSMKSLGFKMAAARFCAVAEKERG
jgi:hypothetical protein